MIHVALCGYGHMGKMLQQKIKHCHDMEITMIVNRCNEHDLYQLKQPIELMLDFSHPDYFSIVSRYVKYSGCALLSGTTGFSPAQYDHLKSLGNKTRVLHSVNYSLGTAVMLKMIRSITPILADDFDMEIMELHHNQKQDAPSGTAKLMLEAIDRDKKYKVCFGRSGMVGTRQKEIGIHSLRGGSSAGEHSILYLGNDEKLEIKHTAISRQIFAEGALKAAYWLLQKPNGFYDLDQMIEENFYGCK